ncbi:MAG TPA: tetratricopeptide repeat protein [Thiotrichales bacterium]|nr:tetratricopeptide repeat protein [Thiotrichales bacterium]
MRIALKAVSTAASVCTVVAIMAFAPVAVSADEAFQARIVLYEKYGPKSEWYANLEKSDDADKLKYLKSAYRLSEAGMRTNLSILLEKAQEMESSGQPATEIYASFADNCKLYLEHFPADSNAYDINWSYAFVLDSKLGRLDDAYEEYIKVSNDYLESGHQHEAALNAVSVADTLVKMKYGTVDSITFNIADIAKLSPEALTPEETRLIEAYDNYLRLFPNGEYAPDFLAAAGSIYYNHKKIPEAKVYFQTLVRRFPGAKQKSLALRSIMDSYFALGKFKDSEIIAKRIMADQEIPAEQREFAAKRLAAAIFKNAEYLAEQGDYFGAANEFYRVYAETPKDPKFVEAALFNAGRNFQKAKDWVRAISVFDTLATKYPQSKYAVPALENMADGYKELQQYVQAGDTYERIYQNYPDSENAETALYNAGYYYKMGEAWQRAIDANNKYIATYPDKTFATDLFFANAELYLKLNNETEANRIYEEFATKYPDDPRTVTAFYERGKYYMEKGLDSKAKEEFNKAIQRSEVFRKSGKDPNAYIAAEALNALGNILHKEYLAIKLTQPPSNLESQKARLRSTLTELNRTYSKVISFGSPRSFEATYNIARSYEEFANIYAHQEIDRNLSEAKQFVEKKRINEESAKLYEKAVDEYKKVIENIPKIAEKLGVDMWAEKTEVEADTFLLDSTQIVRAAEIDSTQLLAQKYYHKAQDKISELLYTEAELTSDNVYQAINIKAPGTNPLQNLIYRFTVLQKVAKPAIDQTIQAHITSIQEAEKMGLSNKYVEESKRQILLTSNIMGEEIEKLAHESLNQYRRIRDEVKVMIEREFEAVNNQGLDYYALDNLASQMIDYVKDLGINTLNYYATTLQLSEEHNIKNDLIRNTEDRMLRFAIEITDEMEVLADSAKRSSEYYRVRFDSTENYNYDDATGFFENYYYNLSDYSKELLDVAFEAKETYGIKNLWANKLIYKLIKRDPLAYSESIEKDTVAIVSDESWKAGTTYYEGEWAKLDFDDSNWEYAKIISSYQNQFSELGVNPDAIWYMETLNAPTIPADTLSDSTSFGFSDTTVTDTLQMAADTSGTGYVAESAEEFGYSDADSIVFFRKTLDIEGTPVSGVIYITADDDYRIYLNGEYLLDDEMNDYSV